MKRSDLLKEWKLRSHVENLIKEDLASKREAKLQRFRQEVILRRYVRRVLSEEVSDKVPHDHTGINVLEELLKSILPQLEDGYKTLTTSYDQRESYKAHILHAVQNSIRIPHADASSEEMIDVDTLSESLDKILEEGDITFTLDDTGTLNQPGDSRKFIDIDGDDSPESEPDPRSAFGRGLEDFDSTGRNVAFKTFDSIEQKIIDDFNNLDNEKDKEVFYDYLLNNLKLYFERWEDELSSNLNMPEIPSIPDSEVSGDVQPSNTGAVPS